MAEIDGYLDLIRNATDGETVRDAIINCMNFINQDGYVKRVPKEIVHEMGEDETWDHTVKAASGEAFSQVHLLITRGSGSVETKEKAVNFLVTNETANDTYYPKDYDGDYFDEVKVDIDWDSMMDDDIQDNIVISRDDLYNDERYPEGGTFSAEDLGYSAMRSITFVDIKGTGGGVIGPGGVRYFKVTFYHADKVTVLDTVTVQEDCDASAVLGDAKIKEMTSKIPKGQSFQGWEPDVKHVKHDMKKVTPIINKDIINAGDEIGDTWEEIAACRGSKYSIGQWKLLDMRFPDGVDAERTIYPYKDDPTTGVVIKPHAANLKMVLVAKGYGGTTSTWVAANHEPVFVTPSGNNYENYIYHSEGSLYNTSDSDSDHFRNENGHIDWMDSMVRHLLNFEPYVFIDNMTYPELIDAIAWTNRYVPVVGKAPAGLYWQNRGVRDKIFVCTMAELFGNRSTMDSRAAQWEIVGDSVYPIGSSPEGTLKNFVYPYENFGQNIYNKSFYTSLEGSGVLEEGGAVGIGGMGETNSLRQSIDTDTRPPAPDVPYYTEEGNMIWIESTVVVKNGTIVPYIAWQGHFNAPSVQFLAFSL